MNGTRNVGPYGGRAKMTLAERLVHKPNALLLSVLAAGPRDTDELMAITGDALGPVSQRVQRLKAWGLVVLVERRCKPRKRGAAYVGVWALAPKRKPQPTEDLDLRIAGRITIGRGAKWGAWLV